MNRWKDIWDKRTNTVELGEDVFKTFVELKKADGFDVQQNDGYYESFFSQFEKMMDILDEMNGSKYIPSSVFEVGCGSGVNLYLFNKLLNVSNLGGIDYSANLVELANKTIVSDDICCMEAANLDVDKKYDMVISDSVFQYFQDAEYGYKVLEKMYDKAEKVIAIKEIHDLSKQEEHLRFRMSTVKDYATKYEGLDKTFYDAGRLISFAENKNCKYKIVKPDNTAYWNNEFVFDFYMIKE